MSTWKVILPEAATNFVLNPTGMSSANVTAVGGGTPTQVTTYSYFGYKCHRLVTAADNTGAYYTLSALANAIHYVSLRIHTASDITPMFDCSLDNATFNTPTLLSQEGNWYIYGFQFPAAQANGSTKLYIQQNGAGADDIYIGHIQVEAASYATTPITGDLKGFTADGYYWNGTAHASSSSRSAQERKGGRVVDLYDTYNYSVNIAQGRGMPPIQHHVQDMALLPGSLFQGHKVMPRVLDLVSTAAANTTATIAKVRKDFINAVKPDLVSPEQPTVFRFTGANANRPVDFYAYYDSGMEYGEPVDGPSPRFIAYDPFAYEPMTQSAVLTTSQSVANADYIARKINGAWYNISTDFDGTVYAIVEGLDGCIYIGGNFTNVGDANGDYIVKWNPLTSTLSSLGTGMQGGPVNALVKAPNGDIYAGGDFTTAGGVANTVYIARWDGTNWNALSTGLTDTCYVLEIGQDGSLYVGGDFTNVGDANGDYIVKWTGASWVSLGTGMDAASVLGLIVVPNGDLYATGGFHLASGVANTVHIAKWNGTTWSALGTGLDDDGHKLTADKSGNIYVGGDFHNADGVACNHIAKWNGKTFEPLGTGTNDYVSRLNFDENGILYVGGLFTSAGGLTLADRFALWNGTAWMHPDINLPSTPYTAGILLSNKNIYIGYSSAGTATTSYLNSIINSGSTDVYPIVKVKRIGGTSATLEWLKNETIGDTLWCNYSLLDGETLTIDLTPNNRSIKSDYFGEVWRAILRGSDFSTFRLQSGNNSISAFINNNGATVTAWLEWSLTHWSADMVAL